MGPQYAAKIFLERQKEAAAFEVTLYGSLAATGRGHQTDTAITEVLEKAAPVNIIWRPSEFLPFHPNGMMFKARDKEGNIVDEWTVYSVGGGALSEGKGEGDMFNSGDIYGMTTMTDIMRWCYDNGRNYWEYVAECEDSSIWDYLAQVWRAMQEAVERGLGTEGRLPGPLNLNRKAPIYHVKAMGYKPSLQSRGLVYSYSLAVSEENASGGTIVTAPTCGACGVLPAVLYHSAKAHDFSDERIIHALATAGLVGNIVKENASISGADVGCQGEVGVACAMASAAACQLFGGSGWGAALFAQQVQAAGGGNAVQPGFQRAIAPVLGQGSPGLQHGLLNAVAGVLPVLGVMPAHPPQHFLMGRHQRLKGGRVAPLCAAERQFIHVRYPPCPG